MWSAGDQDYWEKSYSIMEGSSSVNGEEGLGKGRLE
jgi:hypothetical protein